MEEVLRKIYQQHHSNMQRERIEKVISREEYTLVSRKKYDFREDMTLRTTQTNFSLDEDIRFQKQFYQTKKLYNPSLLESRCRKIKLPFVTNKERRNKLKVKLRAAFFAVLFTERLKTNLRLSLLRRKRKAQKYCEHFVGMVEKTIHNYYHKLLKEELINYVTILQKTIENPKIDQEKESIQMLYYMTQKLASSSLTKDLMGFFVYTATERGFPPSDFLSGAEINRLDFSPKFGCLINVTQEQTRMIIALGLGIKILCFYILYQPWKIEFAGQLLLQNYKKIKQTIENVASVIYFLLLQQFCLHLKEVLTINKQMIANLGVKPIKALDPFGQKQNHSSWKGLISGQSRQFLNTMTFKYPNLLKSIKGNLNTWISRISYACIKESQKKISLKDGASTFFKTIEQKQQESPGLQFDRRRFRSIELTKKRDELRQQNQRSRYHEFPSVRKSIELN